MSKMILFSLALNATANDVNEVIDTIRRTFGIEANGTVAPTDALAAQTTNVVNLPTATASGEVDSKGMVWDQRLHSSSKGKNPDGTWRGRKGLDKDEKAKIEAAIASTTVAAPAQQLQLPTLPASPAPLPQLPAIETPYTKFVQFVAANTKSDENPTGRLTDEWVKAALLGYGIADGSLQNLAHRAELIEPIHNAFKTALGL
jgi:hypothetical protein